MTYALIALLAAQAAAIVWITRSHARQLGDLSARLTAEYAKERSDLITRIQHPQLIPMPTEVENAEPEEPDEYEQVGTIAHSDGDAS